MNREEIVVNGCNGSCCTNFTLPFTPTEFQKCIEAIDKGETTFINDQGKIIGVINDPDIKKIAEMIIYNGFTAIDPQITHSTLSERYRVKMQMPDDEIIIAPDLPKHHDNFNYWFWNRVVEGEIVVNTYTCKHYDTVNQICTNYFDRPRMCSHFGKNCTYTGCNYAAQCNNDCAKLVEILEKVN
jgi:hypothetical protein